MHLADFIGLKLKDIGINAEDGYMWFEFTGGHQLHVKHNDIERATLVKNARVSMAEKEEQAEAIKKAKSEAAAEKRAKADGKKGTTVKKTVAKKPAAKKAPVKKAAPKPAAKKTTTRKTTTRKVTKKSA